VAASAATAREPIPVSNTVNVTIADLIDRTAGEVVTVRGKELPSDATVAQGRAIFASGSVRLIPLLDGRAYAGAVGREDLEGVADDAAIADHATAQPPTAAASDRVGDVVAGLGEDAGRRVVVLADDGRTYVGLMCLDRDRARLCIDAQCHAAGPAQPPAS
jgi:CBS domain-containing protein